MANKSVIAAAEAKLNQLRRDLRAAVIDPDISDEQLLEMRAAVRQAQEEFRELLQKKGFFAFLGF